MLPETKLKVVKIRRCMIIALILVLFRKAVLKWVGEVENRAKCGKMVIFLGLKQGIFPVFP